MEISYFSGTEFKMMYEQNDLCVYVIEKREEKRKYLNSLNIFHSQ